MIKLQKQMVGAFITERMDEIGKTDVEIARECGWPNGNVIANLKTGQIKVPLDSVAPLATALRVDAAYLCWLCIFRNMLAMSSWLSWGPSPVSHSLHTNDE